MLGILGNEITQFTCLGKFLFLRFIGEKLTTNQIAPEGGSRKKIDSG